MAAALRSAVDGPTDGLGPRASPAHGQLLREAKATASERASANLVVRVALPLNWLIKVKSKCVIRRAIQELIA